MEAVRLSRNYKDHFLGWQCRIRQIAMRKDEGRPSPGMRPRVLIRGGRELSDGITVLLAPENSSESTDFFRFQVQKTHDPKEVSEKGLIYLQSTHFQQPGDFSGRLTASFYPESGLAGALRELGECLLEFQQFSQTYRLICSVSELAGDNPARDATLWHNRLFNPTLPDSAVVLGFDPDWDSAQADPAPA